MKTLARRVTLGISLFAILFRGITSVLAVEEEDKPAIKFLSLIRKPDRRDFNDPRDIFIDRVRHNVYIADTGNSSVEIYTTRGMPVQTLSREHRLRAPISVAVDAREYIYVADRVKKKVFIYNFRGDFQEYFPFKGVSDSSAISPTKLTIDSQGNLFVIDDALKRILAFDSKRRLKFEISANREEFRGGNKTGLFFTDIEVDKEGQIYILEANGSKVYVYNSEGSFLASFGEKGGGERKLSYPSALAIAPSGRIYVVDKHRHTVLVFDRKGKYLFEWGGLGIGEGWFYFPVAIDIDAQGKIWVADLADRVQVFEKEGIFVAKTPDGK